MIVPPCSSDVFNACLYGETRTGVSEKIDEAPRWVTWPPSPTRGRCGRIRGRGGWAGHGLGRRGLFDDRLDLAVDLVQDTRRGGGDRRPRHVANETATLLVRWSDQEMLRFGFATRGI